MRVLASCCVLMWWVGAGVAGAQPRVHPIVTVPVVAHFTGIDIDAAGHVFVIDGARGALEAYDARGRLLARAVMGAGAASAGDAAVSVSPAGEVWVAEGKRLTRYALGHGAFEARSHFEIPFDARDVCATKGMVYVLGYQRDTVVHAYATSGRLLRSFGAAPSGANSLTRAVLTAGRIACDARGATVAHEFTPTVTRYTSDGRKVWQTTIASFVPVEMSVDASGVLMVYPPEHGYDAIVSLRCGGASCIAAVAHLKEMGGADAAIGIARSIAIDVQRGIPREEVAGPPTAASTSGFAVTIEVDRVRISRAEASPR